MSKLLDGDIASETAAILAEEFYGKSELNQTKGTTRAARGRPTHYKIVCISLYNEDIERLEAMVAELKQSGHTKANKSAVIRYALDAVDIGKMPRGY